MNILDVKQEDVDRLIRSYSLYGQLDSLELMLSIQRDFMEKYKIPVNVDLNTKEGQDWVRRYVFFMTEELYEMTNCLKMRPWTNSNYKIDMNHVYDELADFVAFFLQVLNIMGISFEKLRDIYIRKMIVNDFRINSKY